LVGSTEGNRQLERYKCEGEINKIDDSQDKDGRLWSGFISQKTVARCGINISEAY
jgi:hypothetical protein